jgi:hypothetical protein
MPKPEFEPCIPTKASKVPDRPEWIREIKHDGYRLIVQRDGKRVRLFTLNGHDWSAHYRLIVEAALRKVTARSCSMAMPCCSASTVSTACTPAGTTTRSNSTPSTAGRRR